MKGAQSLAFAAALVAACATPAKRPAPYSEYHGGTADRARADDARMIVIDAGPYVAGSTTEERATGQ